ncbi:hypothetical protein DEIPH_ctg032orf0127 [Deinococcus phoenicis]|uniref:Uncharacterized protein n=1 Tax=Deinococcus phoenicis TaxID=1476583 RepID=A0A016QPP2_9DEIO|nr:hypothetical protein DEIPH_ctg032orf0127 [Deinococcus phoenicis]
MDYEMGESQLRMFGTRLGLRGYIRAMHDIPLSDLKAIILQAVADECGLVIIDSYASLANQTGSENAVNSNGVAEAVLKPLADLAHQTGVTIVVLHHTNKTNMQYDGSQRIKGLSDFMLRLHLDRRHEQLRLTADKTRFDFEPLAWDAAGHPNLKGRTEASEDGEEPGDKQLDWLLERLSAGPLFSEDFRADFTAEFGVHEKTLERTLSRGIDAALIHKEKQGRKSRFSLAADPQPPAVE